MAGQHQGLGGDKVARAVERREELIW